MDIKITVNFWFPHSGGITMIPDITKINFISSSLMFDRNNDSFYFHCFYLEDIVPMLYEHITKMFFKFTMVIFFSSLGCA